MSRSREYLWSKYRHLFILLYYPVIGILYVVFNNIETARVMLYWPVVDDAIPFIKEMVIPYVFWYPYILLPLVYFGLKDVKSFTDLCFMLFVGMTASFAIFAIFPNGQSLRPSIIGSDLFSALINGIYTADNPINSAPSMHVLTTIVIHFVIANSRLMNKKWLVKASFILMIFISASTVMIKQHSMIDVIAGLFLAIVLIGIVKSKAFSERVVAFASPGQRLIDENPCCFRDIHLAKDVFFAKKRGDIKT